jgi:hypothetical protein
LSRFGQFIESFKQELCLLRSYIVVHVKREANSTAHGQASSRSFTYSIDLLWLEDILRNIYNIICKKFLSLYDLLIFLFLFLKYLLEEYLLKKIKKRKEKETSVLDNLNQKVKRKKIKIKKQIKTK